MTIVLQTYDYILLQQKCLDIEIAQHFNQWKKFAIGLKKNTIAGEDLLQEVLVKMLENQRPKMEQLACEKKLFWYVNKALYRNAFNTSSTYSIKYDRYKNGWSEETDVYSIKSEEVWLGNRLNNEQLDAIIQMMSPIDSVILRLYAFKDFDYTHTSEHTGIPVDRLYKMVESAIKKVRKYAKSNTIKTDSR